MTTDGGKVLGTLVDLDFGNEWQICDLSLAEGQHLPVDADSIRIGDEVIVPTSFVDRLGPSKTQTGLLHRMLGTEAMDDTRSWQCATP